LANKRMHHILVHVRLLNPVVLMMFVKVSGKCK